MESQYVLEDRPGEPFKRLLAYYRLGLSLEVHKVLYTASLSEGDIRIAEKACWRG